MASVTVPIVAIFDGDDTLWSTEPLYDAARARARAEVTAAGIDDAEWERLERRIDVENVATFGFSVDRFPTSCVQAYDAACEAAGRSAVDNVRERIRHAARTVFSAKPPLLAGAVETLDTLRHHDVRLALVTKGDPAIQQMRVHDSGIANRFDAVRIVDDKTQDIFGDVVRRLGGVPDSAWSIGNSMRSDIAPAVAAGLHAIWIDAHVWEHERFDGRHAGTSVVQARTLREVPALVLGSRLKTRRRASAAI